ncbi:GNAT family N-acetyltransferase [Streptomyces gilvosporeus]|uniref:GNAT family N-acetyltransferase n=1 Tax=Streptomyces gilvosporeus TaxID=553510 RepID=A0A1V0U1P7_9ACTN|nr:GNAT family N-acetyltransferase [Streptomyces gilvosporeus]ARF58960.1 GNAT family N-acetyltransferase [Streptomyces gilvosporeus]
MIKHREDGYELSTDPDRLDVVLVHRWLSTDAYWALGRSRETVERSVRGSLNFAVHDAAGAQVAYARVVTDGATFGWLCDVYVAPAHRGKGLGTWMVGAVRDHLAPYGLPRVLLATRDAHEVYSKVGFTSLPNPASMMILSPEPTAGAS